jgi:hypothetical protein
MQPTLSVRITVSGTLSRHLAEAFDGMTAVAHAHATELSGDVADEAQLYGLIARIRDLGLRLESISVVDACERVPSTPTDGTKETRDG